MSTLMKKRKMNTGIQSRVKRLESKVSRQRPDLQYIDFVGTTTATTTVANQIQYINLGAQVTNQVTGDFIIEDIKVTATPIGANLPMVCPRMVLFTSNDSSYNGTSIVSTPWGYPNGKFYKVKGDVVAPNGSGTPYYGPPMRIHSKIGLVAKRSGTSSSGFVRNEPWFFLAYNQTATDSIQWNYAVQMVIREK